MEQPTSGVQSASDAFIAAQTAFRDDQFKEIVAHIESLNPSRDRKLTEIDKRFLLDTSEAANKTTRPLPVPFRREFIRYQHNHKVYGGKQTAFILKFLKEFSKKNLGITLDMIQEDRLLRKCINFIKNAQYRTYTKPPLCNDGRHTPNTFHEDFMWKVCWDDREQVWRDQDCREATWRPKKRKSTSAGKSNTENGSRVMEPSSHAAQSSAMPPPPPPSKSSASYLPRILNHPSDSQIREPQHSFPSSSPPTVSSYSPRIPNHHPAPQAREPQRPFSCSPPENTTNHSHASPNPFTARNPDQITSPYQQTSPLPMFHSHTLPPISPNPMMQYNYSIPHTPTPYTSRVSFEPLPPSNHGFPTWSKEDLDRIVIEDDDGPGFRGYRLPTPSRGR